VVMKEVKRLFLAALMAVILSLSAGFSMMALAQKNDNRPPKPPEKIKQPDKQPRGNTNSQGNSNRNGRS
jgi:hypothetical protein